MVDVLNKRAQTGRILRAEYYDSYKADYKLAWKLAWDRIRYILVYRAFLCIGHVCIIIMIS